MNSLYLDDLVQVTVDCTFPGLIQHKGLVKAIFGDTGMALVSFPISLNSFDIASKENLVARDWYLKIKHLKVLDSPRDSLIESLEAQIEVLEDDLVVCRSCLSMSEELRDKQEQTIVRLIEDIDKLKKELYDARGY